MSDLNNNRRYKIIFDNLNQNPSSSSTSLLTPPNSKNNLKFVNVDPSSSSSLLNPPNSKNNLKFVNVDPSSSSSLLTPPNSKNKINITSVNTSSSSSSTPPPPNDNNNPNKNKYNFVLPEIEGETSYERKKRYNKKLYHVKKNAGIQNPKTPRLIIPKNERIKYDKGKNPHITAKCGTAEYNRQMKDYSLYGTVAERKFTRTKREIIKKKK
jgi:hypothetical protein